MKLKDITEGVIEFPKKDRDRQVRRDRHREWAKIHDEITGLPNRHHPDFLKTFPELADMDLTPKEEFWLVTDDGKAIAVFDTEKEAKKMRPEMEMKYGVRGLHIIPM